MLKRLKTIEDKIDKQLNENKDSQLGIKSIGYDIKKNLSPEGFDALKKIGGKEKKLPTDTLGQNQPPKMTLTLGCSCF